MISVKRVPAQRKIAAVPKPISNGNSDRKISVNLRSVLGLRIDFACADMRATISVWLNRCKPTVFLKHHRHSGEIYRQTCAIALSACYRTDDQERLGAFGNGV